MTTVQTETIVIEQRFHGPPRSGNGGYVCGRIAKHLAGSVAVRLKAPPPLATPLRLDTAAGQAQLFDGDKVIGEAKQVPPLELSLPTPPTLEQARTASRSYSGFKSHAFPACFVCGPERSPHDGLCIYAGPLPNSAVIAAPWTPNASLADPTGAVRSEFLWAALDCPGAFATTAAMKEAPAVLGELCASLVGGLKAGEECVVVAWPLEIQGRKRFAGTAIFTADGRPIAFARAIWIEVPLSSWG
jgi:hypothetical protein